jgi:hypothetical protein
MPQPHGPSGAAGNSFGVFKQDARNACPDGSQTDDRDRDWLVGHFSFLEKRSVKLQADMRFTAWVCRSRFTVYNSAALRGKE